MDAPLHLDAVLRPNRSLPKAGLYVLLGGLAVVNIATAALMVLAFKAAPVPIFLGLDFLAVTLAFRASYRQARQAERVQVSADEVQVTHEIGQSRRTVWRSPTAFTRVELEGEDEDAHVRLRLSGKSLIVARQLSPGERSAFARRLQDAIRRARAERYESEQG
ncbi:MAG TPA: DUF2244 domain-containing protein [Caulobacteraceae bacterium]|nr:DUF2244 domain-containing protein [Caulobacteraceae bacterium]